MNLTLRPAGKRLDFGRWAVALMTVLFLPAACASSERPDVLRLADAGILDTSVRIAEIRSGNTLSGSYLAARHAQAQRDLGQAAGYLLSVLATDPNNPDLLRTATMILAVDGRIAEALPLAERLLAIDKDNPLARIMLAARAMKAGKPAEAEIQVTGLPGNNGISAVLAPLVRAWALAAQNRTDDALAALAPLSTNRGAAAMRQVHTGLINQVGGRPGPAEAAFRETMTDPESLSLRQVQMLGALLESTGRKPEAEALYAKYLDSNPESQLLGPALDRLRSGGSVGPVVSNASEGMAEALFGIANSLRQQAGRDTGMALANIALYLRPDFPLVRVLLGEMFEAEERLEKANEVYNGIPAASPFSWTARMRIAANLDRLDKLDDAVKALEAMGKEYPDRADPYISLGDILRGHERFPESVAAYDKAVQRIGTLGKRHWSLLYARGIALERSKQWSRAEADLVKALEFEPEQPYVLNYLGYSWIDQGLNLERAQKMIEKAVELRPHDGYIVDSLGWAHYRVGNYAAAVKELERAVELRPEDPVINDHLGDAFWKVGRREEARFQWTRALSLSPSEELRPVIEEKLQRGLTEGQAVAPASNGG